MSITLKTIGQPTTTTEIARALQDMFQTFQLLVKAVNALGGPAGAGQLVFPMVDENGTVSSYRLVAGAGVTLNVDTVAKTITITSP